MHSHVIKVKIVKSSPFHPPLKHPFATFLPFNTHLSIYQRFIKTANCSNLPVENGIRYAGTYLVEAVNKIQNTYSIKEGTKWIGESAFYGCEFLASVTLPKSVISIGDYAFSGCYSLLEITSLNTTPPSVSRKCFDNVPTSNCVLYVPMESVGAYMFAGNWNVFKTINAFDVNQKGKATIKVSGKFNSVTGHKDKKVWIYGETPQKEPAFTPGAWDAAAMRFNDIEGKHFPSLSNEVYWERKTLIFDITDISDDARLRVMNGWWSATYADEIPLKEKTKDGLWSLKLTEEIARDCSKGGAGKDLQLMLTSGSATINSVYYEDGEDEEIFSVKGDVDETFDVAVEGIKVVRLVGMSENNDIYVTLDGQTVFSEQKDRFVATVTLRPGAVLYVSNAKGLAYINISGSFTTFTGQLDKEWIYGKDPEKEPAFTPEAWNWGHMRFSDIEGWYFPYLSDDVYWGYKTLFFNIADISDDAKMRVTNGWGSATYADEIPLKKETRDGLWSLKLTEEIAKDCARGNGGKGKDLLLMLTSGSATVHSVYYQDGDEVDIFNVEGNVKKTFDVYIEHEKKIRLVGQADNNAIYVTLDGQPVASEQEDMFVATVTLKPKSELYIANSQSNGILPVTTAPKGGKTYNLQGIEVSDSYRGMVIRNGKKIVKR